MKKYAKKLIALVLAVCLLAGVMPVAMAFTMTVSPIELEITPNRVDGGFELLYQAVTWINADQAEIVLARLDRADKLDKLIFTCVLEDELTAKLPEDYTLPKFYFSSVQVGPDKDELFIPMSEPSVSDGSIVLVYKLNPKVTADLFPTMDASDIRYAIMRPMGMSLYTDLPEFAPDDAVSGITVLHTKASIYMSADGITVPWYTEGHEATQVDGYDMAYGEMETDLVPATRSVKISLKQDSDPFMEGYPDETFKPDGAITRAEVSQVLSRRLDAPARKAAVSFPDVDSGAWYAKAVNELAGLGYLKGDSNGNFRPDAPITRAEMAALLVRFAEPVGEFEPAADFVDVPATHWAYDAIAKAASYGWVNGVGEGRFSPDRPITRAEAAKLFCVVLGRNPDKVAIAMGMGREFADVSADHWAYPYIADVSTARESVKFGSFEIWTAVK